MSGADNAEMVRKLYRAFNTHDFDQAVILVSPDVEVVAYSLGHTYRGIDEFRQFMAGWSGAIPDGKIEILNAVASDEGVAMECRFRGTHTGPLVGPAGTIPPTGRSVDLHFCEVYGCRDGTITGFANYQDSADLLRQLGLMPQSQEMTH